jgi:hypothetical protein
MIELLKELIQEKKRIFETEHELEVMQEKLKQRLSSVECGFYAIDGQLWEIRSDFDRHTKHMVCLGKVTQEA